MRRSGNATRADALVAWVTSQAAANAQVIPETFDETTGAWKFNAPMIGFGAGAYVLALAQRGSDPADPACGAYYDEMVVVADAGTPKVDAGTGMTSDAGVEPTMPMKSGCGCRSAPGFGLLLLFVRRRRVR